MLILEIALGPVIALIIYFYHKDKYEKEPLKLLFLAFICGALVTIPVIFVELALMGFVKSFSDVFIKIFLTSFLVAGFTEEFSKFLIFKSLIYNNKEFNEPYDGIIYTVMISLGFAAFENIGYVLMAYFKTGVAGILATGLLRAIFSVPAHALFGAVMGYFFGLAKFAKNKKIESKYIYKGLMFAIILHGFFDFFLFTRTIAGFALMILTSVLCWVSARRAIRTHIANSPFRNS